ncbi:hypothetical protein ColKHC_12476 [Colletotrichum higginsianum]|nr:hypothetical protein ColKHC_12476 [Colletotrichum higginsianum]
MRTQILLAAIAACASVVSAAPVAVEAYGPPINPHLPDVGSKRDIVEAYGPRSTLISPLLNLNTTEAYGPPTNPHIISKDTAEAYGPPLNPHIPAPESKRDGVEAYGPPTNPHIIVKKDTVEAYGPPTNPHIISKE